MADIFDIYTQEAFQIEIKNIKAGKDINIKVEQFLANVDRYQRLTKRIEIKKMQLNSEADDIKQEALRQGLSELYTTLSSFKVEILEYFAMLKKLENSGNPKIHQLQLLANNGQLDKSEILLNDRDMTLEQQSLITSLNYQDNRNIIYDNLKVNSQEFLVKALLTSLDYENNDRFKRSCRFFEFAVASSGAAKIHLVNHGECLSGYALFLENHNHYNEAVIRRAEAVAVMRTAVNPALSYTQANLANGLRLLGDAQLSKGDITAGSDLLMEGLHLFETLVLMAPDVYMEDYGFIMHSIGMLNQKLRDYDKSEEAFVNAINAFKLVGDDIKKHTLRFYIGVTTANLAQTQLENQKFKKAEHTFLDAIKIYEEIQQTDQIVLSVSLGGVYINIGNLYDTTGEFEKAWFRYSDALLIFDKLYYQNPYPYRSTLALIYNNLGEIHRKRGLFLKAAEEYDKGLILLREAVTYAEDVVLPQIAMVQNNRGIVLGALDEFEDARQAFAEALRIRFELAKNHPFIYLPDYAVTANNLGELIRIRGYPEMSEEYYQLAHKTYLRLCEKLPHIHFISLGQVCLNMGLLYFQIGKNEKTLYYIEASFRAAFLYDLNWYPVKTIKEIGIKVLAELGVNSEEFIRRIFKEIHNQENSN